MSIPLRTFRGIILSYLRHKMQQLDWNGPSTVLVFLEDLLQPIFLNPLFFCYVIYARRRGLDVRQPLSFLASAIFLESNPSRYASLLSSLYVLRDWLVDGWQLYAREGEGFKYSKEPLRSTEHYTEIRLLKDSHMVAISWRQNSALPGLLIFPKPLRSSILHLV